MIVYVVVVGGGIVVLDLVVVDLFVCLFFRRGHLRVEANRSVVEVRCFSLFRTNEIEN